MDSKPPQALGSTCAQVSKHFGPIAGLFLTLALLGLGIAEAFLRQSAPLYPDSAVQGSRIVVDRDGRLLRAFTTPDGR